MHGEEKEWFYWKSGKHLVDMGIDEWAVL